MSPLHRRLLLDLVLTVMLVFEMLYSLTGNTLHELVGFSLFVGVAIHLILSRKWIAGTARALTSGSRDPYGRHAHDKARTLTPRRKGLAIVAALLLVDASLLCVSSLIISTTLASWGLGLWRLNASGLWSTIHHVSAYGLCAITTVHLAMHWTLLAKSMRFDYDPSRRQAIGYAVGAAATLGIVAIGHVGLAKTVDALESKASGNDDDTVDGRVRQKGNGEATQDVTSEQVTVSETPAEDSTSDVAQDAAADSTGQAMTKEEAQPVDGSQDETAYEVAEDETTYVEATESDAAYEETAYAEEPQSVEEPVAETTYVEESQPVGNCPLCHNHCPLSSPSCNRPYAAGLI